MSSKLQMRYRNIILYVFAVFFSSYPADLAPRESYSFDLPRLVVGVNDTTGKYNRVRIIYGGSDDYYVISETDDFYVKNSRNGVEKTIYRESFEKSYQLTNFEAEQINDVCKQFSETLEQFEKNLQNERWGRCLYLDAYLPNFLRGFYYLMALARNSSESVPEEANISESLFDISLNSSKSDERVKKWQTVNEQKVKLRIASKELVFQIKAWQKKELANSKRDVESPSDGDFFKALLFFERIYFNKNISSSGQQ